MYVVLVIDYGLDGKTRETNANTHTHAHMHTYIHEHIETTDSIELIICTKLFALYHIRCMAHKFALGALCD